MAVYYLDSSSVVKRYILERGTRWIRLITEPASGHTLRTVRLTGVEVLSALVRRARGGSITRAQAGLVIALFRADFQAAYDILDPAEPVLTRAMDVTEAHGLRGYDAVHLAAALEIHRRRQLAALSPLIFVSADVEQLRAASAEGLLVDDPNQHV